LQLAIPDKQGIPELAIVATSTDDGFTNGDPEGWANEVSSNYKLDGLLMKLIGPISSQMLKRTDSIYGLLMRTFYKPGCPEALPVHERIAAISRHISETDYTQAHNSTDQRELFLYRLGDMINEYLITKTRQRAIFLQKIYQQFDDIGYKRNHSLIDGITIDELTVVTPWMSEAMAAGNLGNIIQVMGGMTRSLADSACGWKYGAKPNCPEVEAYSPAVESYSLTVEPHRPEVEAGCLAVNPNNCIDGTLAPQLAALLGPTTAKNFYNNVLYDAKPGNFLASCGIPVDGINPNDLTPSELMALRQTAQHSGVLTNGPGRNHFFSASFTDGGLYLNREKRDDRPQAAKKAFFSAAARIMDNPQKYLMEQMGSGDDVSGNIMQITIN
jgi:hypothetical protein